MYRSALIALLMVFAAIPVSAQTRQPVPVTPPDLVPLEDSLEPQVTIRRREGELVEEYRVNGRLYKVKITPDRGEPYYLFDHKGDGALIPHDGPGTPALSVPMWVIGPF